MYSQKDLDEAYKDGFADGLAQGRRDARWHEKEKEVSKIMKEGK